MSRGINEVQLVFLTIRMRIVQGNRGGFNGDAALTLKLHRIKHLRLHFTGLQAAAHLNEAVRKRRFAMIDMRNNRKVTNVFNINRFFSLRHGLP